MINGVAFMVACSRARSQAASHVLGEKKEEEAVVEVVGGSRRLARVF